MSDLKARLERLAGRAGARSDAFERLERRRRRQARNRRLAAGGVALAVALGGTYLAFNAFRGTEGTTPGTEPDTVRITCDRTTIQTDASAVVAQPAGVHVVVVNGAAQPLSFAFTPSAQGPFNATQVEPGATELALQLPPGRVTFACIAEFGEAGTGQVQVDVLDPQGLFVPFDLTCGGEPMLATPPSAVPWPGAHLTEETPGPVEFVRSVAIGLLASDLLERAGYPLASNPVVRAVRDGEVVAVFDLSMGEAGRKAAHVSCAGAGISLPLEPGRYPRGAFEWCPQGPFAEPGQDWSEGASASALRFVEAYVTGDEAAVAELSDPSVPPDAEFPVLAEGAEPAVIGTSASGGSLVEFACGNDVGAYTAAITVDDGTDSASLDFTIYLVLREDGWKVWGVY